MSYIPSPSRAANEQIPPTITGESAVGTQTLLANVATSIDLNGLWGGVSNRVVRGGAYFLVQAGTADIYVRFSPTASTTTTVLNGFPIAAGKAEGFWIDRTMSFIDVVSSADSAIKYFQSSPNYDK